MEIILLQEFLGNLYKCGECRYIIFLVLVNTGILSLWYWLMQVYYLLEIGECRYIIFLWWMHVYYLLNMVNAGILSSSNLWMQVYYHLDIGECRYIIFLEWMLVFYLLVVNAGILSSCGECRYIIFLWMQGSIIRYWHDLK